MPYFRQVVALIGCIGLFAWSYPLAAQTSKGSITGRVVDARGGVLQGAQVSIQPGGFTGSTNNQGQFSIKDIASGNYLLSVSFVGFASVSKDVTIAPDQTVNADLTLQVASQNEQIVVTAERVHGEAERSTANARQRTSCKCFPQK